MIHKPISHIKFLWNSVNAHGVHSPFVFDLVTKCFYADTPRLDSSFYSCPDETTTYKNASFLYRLIHYFKPDRLCVLGDNDSNNESDLLEKISYELDIPFEARPDIQQLITGNRQLIFISHKQKAAIQTSFEQLLPTVKNNTVWILNHVHSSPQMEEAWNTVKSHPQVTVTTDTYQYGVVFFRSEQEKEHFIIRPYRSVFLDTVLGIRTLWGLLS